MANEVREARFIDYFTLQGGLPRIWQDEGGIYHIKHEYREDGFEVTTHIDPKDRGKVIINGVEFEVAKLSRFEGEPCERLSRLAGQSEGYGRDRRR